jgi:PAS domain S-box-containing protein
MTYDTSTPFQIPELYYIALFEALPGSCILLQNNPPHYTVLAATPEYLAQTGYRKEAIIGKGVFEMSPSNPHDPTDTGANDLRDSLEHVLLHKAPHQLAVQRHDIAGEDGFFSERYWRASNKPVFSPHGEVVHIIHSAEDITDQVKAEKREVQIEGIEKVFGLFMHAPMVVGLVDGDNYVLKMANEEAFKLWGKGPEIIGKPILQGLPELQNQGIIDLFDQVRTTGQPYIAHEVPVRSFADGREEQRYFNLVYQPYSSKHSTKPTGVFTISHNVTEQVIARLQAQDSEAKYRTLFESMDQGYCTLEIIFEGDKCVDYRYLETNPTFERHLGMSGALGKTIREIAPDIEPKWFDFYGSVALTGTPIRIEEESKAFNKWFEVYAIRVGRAEERKVGVFFTDVTSRKASELLLKENEALLRTVLDASPNSLSVFEPVLNNEGQIEDLRFVMVNEFTVQTTGRANLVGKGYGVEFPHVRQTGILEAFIEVAKTGIPADFEKWYQGEGLRHWFRFIVNKAGNLVVATVEDITKRKEAEKAMQASEQYARSLFYNSPVAMLVYVGPDMVLRQANEKMLEIFGRGEEIIGKPIMESIPELKTSPLQGYYRTVLETGITHHQFAERVLLMKAGQPYWGYYHYTYKPLPDTEGRIYGVICTSIDVTEQVQARKKIEESETRFRTLADDSPMFVFIIDVGPLAPVSFWNKTWLQYTGQSEAEALGRAWNGIIHPDDIPVVMEHYSSAFSVKQPYLIPSVRVKRHDGEYRWHLFKGNPRYSAAGEFNGYVGVGFDVHEQKLAEEALKQSEGKLRSMILQAPVAMCIFRGKEYVVEIANDSMLEIWGKTREEVIGRPTFEANPEGKGQGFEEILETIYRTGQPYRIHEIPLTLIRHGKKELFYTDLSYDPIKEADGTISGILVVGIEVTQQVLARQKIEEVVAERTRELERANEALQEANKELQRSNQNLEEFAHAASHDLKEPVRKIHFFTNQLKDQLSTQLKEGQARAFSRIENATERMGNLIDDLLLYSHVSQRPHDTESVDLNEKVQRVVEDLDLDIEEKGATIHVGKLPVVKGYRRQLQQLFQNLISNALKYSKADVPPKIEIMAEEVQKAGKRYHLIKVSDNGIGFEQQYAHKIFQMFSRLHGKAEYSGTGVGLSIVKKVVENHNGFIDVESRLGEGSAFSVYLPE